MKLLERFKSVLSHYSFLEDSGMPITVYSVYHFSKKITPPLILLVTSRRAQTGGG